MKISDAYINIINETKDKISFLIDDSDLENSDSITIEGVINGDVFGHITISDTVNGYWKFEDEMSEDEYDELFPDDSFATIETLEISDDYKGKGFARPLMLKALDYIKSTGEYTVYLNASPMGFKGLSIEPLVNFYKSFGFKIIIDDYAENKEMILYLK